MVASGILYIIAITGGRDSPPKYSVFPLPGGDRHFVTYVYVRSLRACLPGNETPPHFDGEKIKKYSVFPFPGGGCGKEGVCLKI